MIGNYTTILYDWDGCLAHTLEIWLDAYTESFASFNLFPTDAEIISKVFGDWEGPLKLGITEEELGGYTEQLLEIVNRKVATVPLYPHAKEVVVALKKQGKKLAILTTSIRNNVMPALEYHGMASLFDVVLTSDEVTNHKPHPESLFTAMEQLHADKETTIMVGDSRKDIQAAQNAGIDSLLFFPTTHERFYSREVLLALKPTGIFEDHGQLLHNERPI